MLTVTVEYRPRGDRSRAETIAHAEIVNDGTGDPHRGNYRVRFWWRGTGEGEWRTGRVENFPRLRLGPWDLLLRALAAAVGARNPEAAIAAERWEDGVAV